jgi:hypothetical protein
MALAVGFGLRLSWRSRSTACHQVVLRDFLRYQVHEPGEDKDGLLDED